MAIGDIFGSQKQRGESDLNRRTREILKTEAEVRAAVEESNVSLNDIQLTIKKDSMARIVRECASYLNDPELNGEAKELTEEKKKDLDIFKKRIRFIVEAETEKKKDELMKAAPAGQSSSEFLFKARLEVEKVVMDLIFGLGPLQKYMDDPDVSDIIVGPTRDKGVIVTVERNGITEDVDVTFADENELLMLIDRIVQQCGRTINTINPMVDASLKDGSRVNACIRPVAIDGPCLSIRKFKRTAITGDDYLRLGSMKPRILQFISLCVKARVNTIISGGTGSGKTTMLNLLSGFIPENEMLITIEDTPELQLQQKHVRRRVVRRSTNEDMMDVTQKALVKNALRERPDRIILGEIRDESIVDMLSAMSTGHEGSMCTVHADNVEKLFGTRIPVMFPANEFSPRQVSMMVADAIQLVVQVRRFPDGTRRVTEVAVVDGIDDTPGSTSVLTSVLYYYDNRNKEFVCTGYRPETLIKYALDHDVVLTDELFEKGTML